MSTKKYFNELAGQTMNSLYGDKATADIKFVFGIREINAHKCILAKASSVFFQQFYQTDEKRSTMNIDGIDIADFETFLTFFYRDEIELTGERVAGIMHLMKTYEVVVGFDRCIEFLKDTLSVETVCVALALALKYKQSELRRLCEHIILLESSAVFRSTGFLSCDRQIVIEILKSNNVTCEEHEIFAAVIRWIKDKHAPDGDISEDIIRREIGLLNEIRYRSIGQLQFQDLIREYGKFIPDDMIAAMVRVISGLDVQTNQLNQTLREFQIDNNELIKCYRANGVTGMMSMVWNVQRCTFSTSQPLLLIGFVVSRLKMFQNGVYDEMPSKLPTKVSLYDYREGSNQQMMRERITFNSSLEQLSETNIMLQSPMLISPDFKYTIDLEQQVYGHCFWAESLNETISLTPDTRIIFFNDNETNGHKFSFIAGLFFNKVPDIFEE